MIASSEMQVERSTAAGPRIAARVLGGFEVSVDGRRLEHADWQRISAQRLAKLLLVTPGHRIAREVAAETLWPEAEPEASRVNLRKALHFARRALAVPGAVTAEGATIELAPGMIDVDLDRLEAALDLASGRRSSDAMAAATATILELGALTLLPDDLWEDWLASLREQLRSRWQVVAMQAAHDAASRGRRADAHAILEQVLDRDPTDEAAHRLAIELYTEEGRHHAARRQYELCRAALREGLDVVPTLETESAYRLAEQAASRATVAPGARARLVARQRELELIEPLLDRVGSGQMGVLLIRGPAGIGKTRLLEEVRDYVHGPNWRVLHWQAVETTRGVALAPLAVRLAEELSKEEVDRWHEPARSAVATVAPGLDVTPRMPFVERSALVAGLVAALERIARARPLVISIDDLAWLDSASVDVLRSTTSALTDAPILLVLTYRDEEPMPEAAASLLDELRRRSVVDLQLAPLAPRDIEPLLVGHLGGEGVSQELAWLLHEKSDGNPLFCLELARVGRDRGVVRLERDRWALLPGETLGEAPATVRHLVAARSRSLPAPAVELLRVAAELGHDVPYVTLAAALPDLEGGPIPALDAVLAAGLMVERGNGYAFAHPLFRAAVGAAAGSARRARTHLAIARALAIAALPAAEGAEPEWLAVECPDPVPVAEHALAAYDLGLSEAGPLAVSFGFAGGHRARLLFDRSSATQLLERALVVWQRLPGGDARRFDACGAFTALAELRMAAGDEAAAEQAFRLALSVARTPDELGHAYERFTWMPYRHGDFEGTIALCEEALARLPSAAAAARAEVRATIGWCLGRLHRTDDAVASLEEATRVLEAAGALDRLDLALDRLGMMLRMAGRTDEALAALERSLAIALSLHDLRGEGVRLHLGVTLTRSGRPAQAKPHLMRALELMHQMGEWYLESVAAWGAAELEDALGNLEAAREMRLRELTLLDRIGGNPHNEALSHAHLAHIARLQGDADEARREAATARELVVGDRDPGYAEQIERALGVARWTDLETG